MDSSVSLKYLPEFLQTTIFLRESSILTHLVLLFGLIVSWFCKLCQRGHIDHPRDTNSRYSYIPLIISSFALSLYNLALLCCLCYFCGFSDYSTINDEKVATLLDLSLRGIAWLLVSLYIHTTIKLQCALLLRLWWGLYLVVSSYSFLIHVIARRRDFHQCLRYQDLVSDIVSVLSGIFFCCATLKFSKFSTREDDYANLHEPLLHGETSSAINHEAHISPYVNAGFFSHLTFSWVGSLISKGHEKRLDLGDVPNLCGKDNVSESYENFKNSLDFARDGDGNKVVTTMQLARSLIFMSWGDIIITGFLVLMHTLASYVGPYLIDMFVQYVNGNRTFKHEGYVLVSVFFVAKLVGSLSQIHSEFRLGVIGIRTKAVLIESIYEKVLALSCQSKQVHTSGEMINFMSVDAERVGQFSADLHDPWVIILQVVLALLLLYRSLGLASIAAFLATVLVMLVNIPMTNLSNKYEEGLMESKDRRMKATCEMLKNMRILKLQAWDMKFLSRIFDMRNAENGWLKKCLYTSAMMTSVFWVAPTFVSVATFGTCVILGIPLESGKVLSTIATFGILQEAIYFLPNVLSTMIQTKVSLSRIALFFSLDDLDPNSVEKFPRSRTSDVAVEISGGNFTWDVSASSPTLQNIDLKVRHGMRIAVCGTVGSGKSTLLSCILGEVPKVSGTVRLSGSKAYVPQTPWIQSGKLVDNILFGQEMDGEKYNKVLEACSLKKDLQVLSYGDQTIIGERGINLSGGQKQRIQIARALYQDADIYLFDDPFSALDAHTGSHLFKECLLGILESKTVIYVTHQVEFLPAADMILVMKDGRILQAGTYNDILESGTNFKELVGAHENALSVFDSIGAETNEPASSDSEEHGDDKKALEAESCSDDQSGENDNDDQKKPKKRQLVEEEEREKGRVGLSVYWKYITAAYGGALVPFILSSQVLFQLLQILSNYWMASATPISADSKAAVFDRNKLIIVYISLAIGSSLCILARATLLVTAAYKTATMLFNKMHCCIFRAPMSFFDSIPSGRILNRASTDQSAVDIATPYRVGGFAFSLITLLGTIVVMSQVAWQVYVIFIPTLAISLWYQQYYLSSARELFRLVGVTKAPVIQHFSETMSGVAVVRSFDQESRFCETSVELINGYSRPRFYSAAANNWLSFRLHMLSSVVFACFLIFLISVPMGFVSPVLAGLAVTYALNLNNLQNRVLSNLSLMENRIISVERILQYTNIESEAQLLVDGNRPDPSWPSCGEVHVQDLQVRYAPGMSLVLRGITCTFQGGKKTGIVGRTGCGKSTLIQALFRIMEPAAGRIIIDGVEICSIGLHDLRSRLSIIPQDPIMFEGTVRSNLDPLDEYTTHQIWEALDKCQLGVEVRKKEGKLDSIVSENGENWSAGQRQLFCLGRVLLKRSKILVLDEATASVDTATDNVIQQILKEHFADSTVIIIAHRITSVIDSNNVVLLSDGVVEECDSPSRLLEDQSSSFAKLVAEYTTRSKSRGN